ncbi:MAG: phosphatidate cytidylyltransferase, partial [Sphingomonadales bacterium]
MSEDTHTSRPGTKSGALGLRVLSAAVLVPLALGLVYLGGWALAALVAVAGVLMLHEWNRMTEATADGGLFLMQATSLVVAIALMALESLTGAAMVAGLGVMATVLVAHLLGRGAAWAAGGFFYALLPG